MDVTTRAMAAPPPVTEIAGLEPMTAVRRRWPTVLGALVTAAMVAGLARQLLSSGLAGLSRAVPDSPWFYVAFAAMYFAPPFFDFVIFRRLWGLPWTGFGALTRKRIANEVLFDKTGETYFYLWARARAHIVAAPFGAVKDVSILSAIAGNAITLALCAVALPLGRKLLTPAEFHAGLWSVAATLAMSLPFLIFRKRVFSLERPQLWWIFAVHCLRLLIGSLLMALAWHLALPGVALGMWVFLAAARLLVSRLPFIPNKDLLFANFAILLIGQDGAVSSLIAFMAAMTLLVHVALMIGFAVQHAAMRHREWRAA